jgi:hypothetical protein
VTEAERLKRREEWRQRVADFKASGKSGAAWCAERGIKPHLLYYCGHFAPFGTLTGIFCAV